MVNEADSFCLQFKIIINLIQHITFQNHQYITARVYITFYFKYISYVWLNKRFICSQKPLFTNVILA